MRTLTLAALVMLVLALLLILSSFLLASNGQRALELARADLPDLIVLDLMLPQVSGWDVCRELRRNPRTARVPIIMATARDDISDRIVGHKNKKNVSLRYGGFASPR